MALQVAAPARAQAPCVEVSGTGPDEVQDAVRQAIHRAHPAATIQAETATQSGDTPGDGAGCDVQVRFIDEVDGVRLKISRQGQTEFRRASKLGPILDLGGLIGASAGAGILGLCAWGCAPLVTMVLFIQAFATLDASNDLSSPVTWWCGTCSSDVVLPGMSYLLCCGLPGFSGYWGGRTFMRYREKAFDQSLLDAVGQSFTALRVRDEDPKGAPYVGFTLDDALPFAY